ncbi:hypothetical protein RDWZM_008685, partial [Blomia tropicalis]
MCRRENDIYVRKGAMHQHITHNRSHLKNVGAGGFGKARKERKNGERDQMRPRIRYL